MSPTLLYVLGGLMLGIVAGNWKPLAFLQRRPEVAQLSQAQADLAKAKADAEAKEAALVAAQTAERSKLEAQVRSAQQDNVGAVEAWKRIPAASRGAEVNLVGQMQQRVSLKLAAAIGHLPPEDQQAMVELIAGALSDKQAEVDAANAKLAARDAAFASLTVERDQIKAEIPVLTDQAVKAKETAQVAEAKVETKTEEVKQWAAKKDAADRAAGSLTGALGTAKHWVEGLAVAGGLLLVLALYLRMGLGSVGRALQPLQQILPPDQYAKVVTSLDSETDKLHQWLIRTGRQAAAKL